MATTVTKTIKSAGGDYTTVAAWEAGNQGDLVTADEVRVGEIYDVNTTAALTVDGSTTDATRYMHLTVNSAYRHAGVWDTGKQNFQVSSTDATVIVADDYFHASYLQLRNTHATNGGSGIRFSNTGGVVEQLVIRGTAGALNHGVEVSNTAGANFTVRNTNVSGCHNGLLFGTGTGTTVQSCTSVANRGRGVSSSLNAALAITNLYAGGNTGDDYNEGGTVGWSSWTGTTCMCQDAITETGLTNSIAYSTANFTNVTAGSEDLHLVTGSALIDAGTDLSGSFTVDIDGVTRTGTWDVGADEYVAGGGGATFKAGFARGSNVILQPGVR